MKIYEVTQNEKVDHDENLQFRDQSFKDGSTVTDIFYKGKFVGSIGKHRPRDGRPEGYYLIQYRPHSIPKGSGNIHRHERIDSRDEAKKLVAKHFMEEITLEDDQDFHEEFGYLAYVEEEGIFEAEYQGRNVKLNKPMRGDVKKFKVYVKNAKGNVVKVNFGDPNMRIKKSNPARRRSFRARHNCDNPGPKWKARYWSCRKW